MASITLDICKILMVTGNGERTMLPKASRPPSYMLFRKLETLYIVFAKW